MRIEVPVPTDRVHQERAAKNQSLFREVNERIEELAFTEFICECCLDGCEDKVSLTHSEYEEIRGHPTWFVVLPGHVDPKVEAVVFGAGDRYEVVEKVERAAEVAARLDPRGRELST